MSIKKNTLWNLFGSSTPMLIGIAAIPYIYEQIGIERIGVLTIIWALIGYFSIFDLGLGRAITQRIAGLKSTQTGIEKKIIATTGVSLTLLIGVIGGLAGLAVIELSGLSWINPSENLYSEIHSSFLLACLTIPATTATAGLRGILEGELEFKTINILKLILGLSNFLGPIVSIILFGPRLDLIVESLVLVRYLILIAHYFAANNKISNIGSSFKLYESKYLFKFGGWMTVSNIVSPLMVVADRFFIANVLGAAVVAYYTIPAEFMMRLLILPASITTSLFPVFSRDIAERNYIKSYELYKKSMRMIFLIMGAIAVVIILGADHGIKIWLGQEFSEKSSDVLCALAIGILFNSMAQIPHAYIQASGDARSTALIHVFESLLYIPSLLLMLQLYGIFGAAVAWMFRALTDLILLHARATRKMT